MPVLRTTPWGQKPTLTEQPWGRVKLRKEIILGRGMEPGGNPFDEENETEINPFSEEPSPGKNPFDEEEEGEGDGEVAVSPTASPNGDPQNPEKNGGKYGTLNRIFRKGKQKTPPGQERRNLFGLHLSPSESPTSAVKSPDKKRGSWLSDLKLGGDRRKPSAEGEGEKDGEGETTSPVAQGGQVSKKLSFSKPTKGGRRESQPETSPPHTDPKPPTTVTIPEALSVLEIHTLIKRRELVLADGHIAELEEESERLIRACEGGGEGGTETKDCGRKAKDVSLLYQALEAEAWLMVSESLEETGRKGDLEQVVRVIELEEEADKKRVSQGEMPDPGPNPNPNTNLPRQLRKKWRDAVKASVSERVSRSLGHTEDIGGQRLAVLQELMVKDLVRLRDTLAPAYPREYEAFGLYVSCYHQEASACLSQAVSPNLNISQLFTCLDWAHNVYSREVLGHPELAAHVRRHQLGSLLPEDTLRSLEERSVSMVKDDVTSRINQALDSERETWTEERKECHSDLANRVIEILREHVEMSASITEELALRIAQCCLSCLNHFLLRYQDAVCQYYQRCAERAGSPGWFVPQTVSLVNSCPVFRDYTQRLAQKVSSDTEEETRRALGCLSDIERDGHKLLLDHLFHELKPLFGKLIRKKWLQSNEGFESLVSVIHNHFTLLHKMNPPPYQALVDEVHRRVVAEYLKALLHTRLICRSGEMRSKVATRLSEEATRLTELFEGLGSLASWLDSAIEHLAEIIRMKDVPSIQLEVGMLFSNYPDVRRGHVTAVLAVRGGLGGAQGAVLDTVRELEAGADPPPRDHALFAQISPAPPATCTSGPAYCWTLLRRR